jgi:hypothetical protein
MAGEAGEQTPASSSSTTNLLTGSSHHQTSAGHSTSNIPATALPPTGTWPNKKADYELIGKLSFFRKGYIALVSGGKCKISNKVN